MPGFFPAAKFSFTRAYVEGISLRFTAAYNVQFFDYDLVANYVPNPVTLFKWHLRPEVFEWSSNHYTLDHLVTSAEYFNSDTLTWFPLPYNVGIWFPPTVKKAYLWISEPDFDASGHVELTLPPANQPYWLPL